LRVVEENDKLREGVFDQVYFCPFTGELLPKSLRDVWFDKLDDLKLDPQSPNIPEEMQTDKWWLSET
jgi:hypothetical protein